MRPQSDPCRESHCEHGKIAKSLVSRRPTLKRGSGETLYKKFELWNVYWMTFYVLRKCTVYVTTFNQIRLQHHQTNSATLFIQH